jgi:hypothetical protein
MLALMMLSMVDAMLLLPSGRETQVGLFQGKGMMWMW